MTHKMQLSKKQIGILWMTIPFFLLFLTLMLFSLSGGMVALLAPTESGWSLFRGGMMGLGLLGVISILGLMIGVPVGLYFFSRVEPHEVSDLGRRVAYESLSHEQVMYIAKWSWSAFFMHWIWTLCNRGVRFWTLGFFAPVIQQYMWVKVAMHGRRMSWESGKWRSFKQFRKRQTILAWVAWIWGIIGAALLVFMFAWIPGQVARSMFSAGLKLESYEDPSHSMTTSASALQAVPLTAKVPVCEGVTDVDEDGLIDKYEAQLNAYPGVKDTDGDGFADGEELENGYDPGGPGVITEKQRNLYLFEKGRAEQCLK